MQRTPITYIRDIDNTNVKPREHSATPKDSGGKLVWYAPAFTSGTQFTLSSGKAREQVNYIPPNVVGTKGTPAHRQNKPIVYVEDVDNTSIKAREHSATSKDAGGKVVKYVPTGGAADYR